MGYGVFAGFLGSAFAKSHFYVIGVKPFLDMFFIFIQFYCYFFAKSYQVFLLWGAKRTWEFVIFVARSNILGIFELFGVLGTFVILALGFLLFDCTCLRPEIVCLLFCGAL